VRAQDAGFCRHPQLDRFAQRAVLMDMTPIDINEIPLTAPTQRKNVAFCFNFSKEPNSQTTKQNQVVDTEHHVTNHSC
jgi:hypothetical protein